MEVDTIIRKIWDLPLNERFLIVEKTLESIKKEELKNETRTLERMSHKDSTMKKVYNDFSVNEQSLAEDWLSEEDKRWDKLL